MPEQDRFRLPLLLLGVVAVHGLCLAAILPMLITLPGEGRESVAVDVELAPVDSGRSSDTTVQAATGETAPILAAAPANASLMPARVEETKPIAEASPAAGAEPQPAAEPDPADITASLPDTPPPGDATASAEPAPSVTSGPAKAATEASPMPTETADLPKPESSTPVANIDVQAAPSPQPAAEPESGAASGSEAAPETAPLPERKTAEPASRDEAAKPAKSQEASKSENAAKKHVASPVKRTRPLLRPTAKPQPNADSNSNNWNTLAQGVPPPKQPKPGGARLFGSR